MLLINMLYVQYIKTPAWIICLVAVCSSITVSLLGLLLFRKIYPNVLDKANNDFISLSLSTVGLFSSVLISLIVVNTWNFYNTVEQIVNQEAHAVEDFYRAAQGMPEPTKSILVKNVKNYIEIAITEEWPEMNAGKIVGDKGRKILLNAYDVLLNFKTHDPIIANIHSKLLNQLSNLFDARRDRILSTKTHVPGVIWLVMFLSYAITPYPMPKPLLTMLIFILQQIPYALYCCMMQPPLSYMPMRQQFRKGVQDRGLGLGFGV